MSLICIYPRNHNLDRDEKEYFPYHLERSPLLQLEVKATLTSDRLNVPVLLFHVNRVTHATPFPVCLLSFNITPLTEFNGALLVDRQALSVLQHQQFCTDCHCLCSDVISRRKLPVPSKTPLPEEPDTPYGLRNRKNSPAITWCHILSPVCLSNDAWVLWLLGFLVETVDLRHSHGGGGQKVIILFSHSCLCPLSPYTGKWDSLPSLCTTPFICPPMTSYAKHHTKSILPGCLLHPALDMSRHGGNPLFSLEVCLVLLRYFSQSSAKHCS